MSFLALLATIFAKRVYRLSGLIIIFNLLAVFALRELGFPEYYLAFCYIPTLILLLGGFSYLTKQNSYVLTLLVLILIFLNVQKYDFTETTFSLSRKIAVAKSIRALDTPVDLRFNLAPGREGGIVAFYRLFGGKQDQNSPLKVVITDQTDGPIIEGGELANDMGRFGGIRLAKIGLK
jgi:hypothetical protein